MSKKIDLATCTIEEFWMYVAANLKKAGYDTVLVGGGVATIYSDGAYMSGDIDLVPTSMMYSSGEVAKVLIGMGFNKNQRSFAMKGCKFTIDVSSFPVTIGDDYVPEESLKEAVYSGQTIRMLSPTDCILDRLNKAAIYNDDEALNAAVHVAKRQAFKIGRVEGFCKTNNITPIFDRFIQKYSDK